MNEREVAARLKDLAEFRYQVRRFIGFSDAASEAGGVSGQQYQMLQVVGTAEARATISYIADRMVLRHNSAVELVDRGVKAGLVRRGVDEADHRRSVVEMTAKGREMLMKLAEEHLTELERVGPEIVRALNAVVGR
jgi:DNA-binding MarR family transcriptional regulator